MNTTSTEPQQIYTARDPVGLQAAAFFIGGALFLLIVLICFLVMLLLPPMRHTSIMPGVLGGISVLGLGLCARGFFLVQTTRSIILDDAGVHVKKPFSCQSIAWKDIHRIERDKKTAFLGSAARQVLKLIDVHGTTLAVLMDSVADFPQMSQAVIERSHALGNPLPYNLQEDDARRVTRAAKHTRRAGYGFCLFALLMLIGFSYGLYEESHLRRFATEGVHVEAAIVKAYLYNVTPHVEYSFTDQQGQTHSRDVTMFSGKEWHEAEHANTIAVEYLPSAPEWNRLLAGQDAGPSFAGPFLFVTGFGTLFLGGLSVMALRGYDFESNNGLTTLSRHGKVIRTWGNNK